MQTKQNSKYYIIKTIAGLLGYSKDIRVEIFQYEINIILSLNGSCGTQKKFPSNLFSEVKKGKKRLIPSTLNAFCVFQGFSSIVFLSSETSP